MTDVLFGNVSAFDDFGMILTGKEIGYPDPKTTTLDVPGRDGVLDYTGTLTGGEVRFSNRQITLTFANADPARRWNQTQQELINMIHGQKINITITDDPGYYYIGRCTVDSFDQLFHHAVLTVKVDAEPFKVKTNSTTETFTATSTEQVITLQNEYKPVVPVITTTGTVTLSFGDDYEITKTMTAGTYAFPELVLSAGENHLKLRGSGRVDFVYREGAI